MKPLKQKAKCICSMYAAFFALITNHASAIECEQMCASPQKDANTIIMNAGTGRYVGETEYERGDQYTLITSERNAYKYDYNVKINTEATEAKVIGEFLKFIGIDLSTLLEDTAQNVKQVAGAPAISCPAGKAGSADLSDARNDINNLESNVKQYASRLQLVVEADSDFSNFRDEVNKLESLSPTNCKRICEQAVKLTKTSFPNHSSNWKVIESLNTNFNRLNSLASDAESSLKTAEATACGQHIIGLANRMQAGEKLSGADSKNAQSYTKMRASFETNSTIVRSTPEVTKKLKENKPKIKAMNDRISEVHTLTQPFHASRNEQFSKRQSEEDEIILERKIYGDKKADYAQVGSSVIVSGGASRFTISGGIGVSFIEEEVVGRQSALIDDGMGGTEVGSVFGLVEDSDETFGLALQLNAEFGRKQDAWDAIGGNIGWGLALGISLEDRDDQDDLLGFYVGPYASFLDGQLFITPALHVLKVERLSDGFKVGDPIPEGVNDPLPTKNETETGFILTLTYKLR